MRCEPIVSREMPRMSVRQVRCDQERGQGLATNLEKGSSETVSLSQSTKISGKTVVLEVIFKSTDKKIVYTKPRSLFTGQSWQSSHQCCHNSLILFQYFNCILACLSFMIYLNSFSTEYEIGSQGIVFSYALSDHHLEVICTIFFSCLLITIFRAFSTRQRPDMEEHDTLMLPYGTFLHSQHTGMPAVVKTCHNISLMILVQFSYIIYYRPNSLH